MIGYLAVDNVLSAAFCYLVPLCLYCSMEKAEGHAVGYGCLCFYFLKGLLKWKIKNKI